jgi:hypothetical protein
MLLWSLKREGGVACSTQKTRRPPLLKAAPTAAPLPLIEWLP